MRCCCDRMDHEGGIDCVSGAQQAPRPPAAAKTVLDLAVTGLRLPGGESTAAGLIEGVVCLSPPTWFGTALQAALAARDAPDSQDAVLRMLQRLPISSLPAPVAVEAMSQVNIKPEMAVPRSHIRHGMLARTT